MWRRAGPMAPAAHASLTLAITPWARSANAASSNAGSCVRSAFRPSACVARSTSTSARSPPRFLVTMTMTTMTPMITSSVSAAPGDIDPPPPPVEYEFDEPVEYECDDDDDECDGAA